MFMIKINNERYNFSNFSLLLYLFCIIISYSKQFNVESSHIISLSNGNFLLISEKGIFTYDYSFSKIIYKYSFNTKNKYKNNNLIVSEISNNNEEYILCFNHKILYFFNEYGQYVTSIELNSIFYNYDIIELSPYKIINSYFYFIVVFNNIFSQTFIKIIRLNISLKIIYEFKPIKFNSLFNSKINCHIMNSFSHENVLACFYLNNEYTYSFHVSIFDINNGLKQISTKSVKYDISLKTDFKSIISQDKKICIIYISNDDKEIFIYYYIDINKFFIQSLIINNCNYFNIFHIKTTKEFIGGCLNSNKEISMIQFNNNLEISDIKNEILNIKVNNNNPMNFFIIDYSFIYKKYLLISNFDLDKNEIIKNSIYILSEFSNQKQFKNDLFNTKILNNINYFHEKRKNNYVKTEVKKIRFLNEKCKENDEISLKNSLCVECNSEKGYYPKIYNYDNNENFEKFIKYKECHNNKTIPNNFYFDSELKVFKQCYESCLKCFGHGDQNDNNCSTCDFNYIFKPETHPTKNCVKNCPFYYYFSLSGEYKCTDNYYCPENISFAIEDKKKCIYDCKMDDIYIFEYNGECLKKCPENTYPNSLNQCLDINTETCAISIKNTQILGFSLTYNIINELAKNYAKEFLYTNNHVSQFIVDNYIITFFKNKSCLLNLHLNNSIIDYDECLNLINESYNISSPLIVIVDRIGRYNYLSTKIAFFNPVTGEKLDTLICGNTSILIHKNISSIYNKDKYEWLVNQNIDIYNINHSFYSSLCFPFDSNKNRDITIKDRFTLFCPTDIICEDNCDYNGTNYTTLISKCLCKYNETLYFLINNNLLEDDILLTMKNTTIIFMAEFNNFKEQLRIFILFCFKRFFTFKNFIRNIGGIIILILIIIQIIFILLLIRSSFIIKINNFILLITNLYIYNKNKKNNIKNGKGKKRKKEKIKNSIIIDDKKKKPDEYYNTIPIGKDKLNKEKKVRTHNNNLKNGSDKENTQKNSSSNDMNKKIFETSGLVSNNMNDINKKDNKRKRNSFINIKNINYLDNYTKNGIFTEKDMKEYLSSSPDNMDFYDVLKKDKRTFSMVLVNLIVKKQKIVNTFFIEEETIPKYLKIIVFILYIDLFLLLTSIFYGPSDINGLYYIENKKDYVNFFFHRLLSQITFCIPVTVIIDFLVEIFFVDKESLKTIIKREKDDEKELRTEIKKLTKSIKIRYILLIVLTMVIMLISWYYVGCFNNAYPNTKLDWISLSIIVIVISQIISAGLALIETCLRFIAIKYKYECLFKLSKYIGSII